jgi:hypothetical protein
MTLAQYDLRYECDQLNKRGVSVFLEGLYTYKWIDTLNTMPFWSTGTSGSAHMIERYLPKMFESILDWENVLDRLSETYQEEIVVFMPPKKRYEVDLEINYLGRAKPFISIDQMDMELDVD